ncbi:Alpha/Beta hydrolase protein [Pavlovales sp. CCMP2436]|nr:Alpha/Beta hydrolase protein [Pavlovales sp. CCMP2436]
MQSSRSRSMAVRTLALLAAATRAADGFQSMGRLLTSSPQAYIDSLDALTPRGGTRLARPLRQLHPGTGSRSTGRLEVGSLPHSLYYEVHGSTDVTAPTALMLHGGPGAGCFSRHAQFFAPDKWRVVLFDQRGCGRSAPADRRVESALSENSLEHLVGDCEALRLHLNIDRWALCHGGSWGTTLALAYAQAHPSAVRALLLRGMCTMRRSEVLWMFGALGGAAQLQPEGWKAFAAEAHVTDEDRSVPDGSGVVRAYARALAGPDAGNAAIAARGWMNWESRVSAAGPGAGQLAESPKGEYALLECLPRAFAWGANGESSLNSLNCGAARWRDDGIRARSNTEERNTSLYNDGLQARSNTEEVVGPAPSTDAATSSAQGATPSTQQTSEPTSPPTAAAPSKGGQLYAQPLLTSDYCIQALDSASGCLEGSANSEGGLLNPIAIRSLRKHGIRCVIVQGLRDSVCPPTTAFELKKLWPEAQLQLCIAAGHSMYSPPIQSELLRAVEMLRPDQGDGWSDWAGPGSGTAPALKDEH